MAMRKLWSETGASKVEPSSGNYIKLENLQEKFITIVDVNTEPSAFDNTKMQVRVTFTYDEDEGSEMGGMEYQFTTTQSRIMERLAGLTEEDIPVGPVTIFESGRSAQYGTVFYDIGDTIPELARSPQPAAPKAMDIRQDANRQRLAGQSLRSKSLR
jgi:hypothetical protein